MTRPLLKFCGNQSFEDTQAAVESQADFIGFIFTDKSKRTVKPKQVADWVKRLGPIIDKKLVGVFADDSLEKINSVLQEVPLNLIQLHGQESPEQVASIKRAISLPIWKAMHHDKMTLCKMRCYRNRVEGFVIDTKVKGQIGGTGISFDWSSVPEYMREAVRQHVPCFVAGGITAENISKLLRFRPIGIDLASGIERAHHKDRRLIRKIEEKVCGNGDKAASVGEKVQYR
ncbi:phosphoribosylanthranilate isomerase [Sporolactobacillus shoreicorticis]|uniref:N-(5'-phosphoribosyl)anthranilate isomerase n=1 Tax=Sporolactobacillus shoreicorticis TaxID=1923877 RepID=A0ABW5S0Z9_9BACL|nr:phosphoribosylanthranilate isomerase [Sporolactobacillus shoreicorticis]MCO7127029.1 phosphoribosylanthranilate isomerase [Sporolactobacillus shoreicorticis]